MYIPKQFYTEDKNEIVAFMKQFSFATIITATENNIPQATHLPFTILTQDDKIILSGHFARANPQWENIETKKVLVIFTGPHAYISPKHYDKEQSVPTWNYFSVHAYGDCRIIKDYQECLGALEEMIANYEIDYKNQWDHLPEDFKTRMIKGLVPFEITVTDLQASKKMSQNKTIEEQHRIIDTLANSNDGSARQLADYMKQNRST